MKIKFDLLNRVTYSAPEQEPQDSGGKYSLSFMVNHFK